MSQGCHTPYNNYSIYPDKENRIRSFGRSDRKDNVTDNTTDITEHIHWRDNAIHYITWGNVTYIMSCICTFGFVMI